MYRVRLQKRVKRRLPRLKRKVSREICTIWHLTLGIIYYDTSVVGTLVTARVQGFDLSLLIFEKCCMVIIKYETFNNQSM